MLEDLLLDHGEAALNEGSISSSVPRHAFILNKKFESDQKRWFIHMFRMHRMYNIHTYDYLIAN